MLQGRSDNNLQRLAQDYPKERANVGFLCHPPVPPQLTFLRGAAAAFQQSITVPGQSMQVIVSTFGENFPSTVDAGMVMEIAYIDILAKFRAFFLLQNQ